MNLRLRRRIASLAGFFVLGMGTDALVVVWYRSVSSRMVFLAMSVSFLVTLVPFLVTRKGIEAKRIELFFAYALGASVGTLIGMLIRL
jgi:uncharacterized protein YebE (UPF0316 family)